MKSGTYPRPKPFTKKWAHQKYIVEQLTCKQIGKLVHRDAASVLRWLQKFGIPTRPRGTNQKIFTEKTRARMRASAKKRTDRCPFVTAVCQYCSTSFRRSRQTYGYQKFCSRKCFGMQLRGKGRGGSRPKQDPKLARLYVFMRNCIHRLGINTKGLDGVRLHSTSILGYGVHELRHHLETQFAPEMGWHNYGGTRHAHGHRWVIDHIHPIRAYLESGVHDPRVIN